MKRTATPLGLRSSDANLSPQLDLPLGHFHQRLTKRRKLISTGEDDCQIFPPSYALEDWPAIDSESRAKPDEPCRQFAQAADCTFLRSLAVAD